MSFVSIARIVKPRGIRGEVVAELLTDFPDRFSTVRQVRIFQASQVCNEELEQHWFHGGRVVLKFKGRGSPEEVQELIGGDVQVPESERYSLPQDFYYHSDLIGCRVVENDKSLGVVTDIFETGAAGVNLVISTSEGEEFMIPMVRKFVLAIDVDKKQMEVESPSGLIIDR